ncbi:ribosome small subunit-dependent GTPase A [Runella sp.]|uniref:ribosome small subunit-dependent GTPase A n=1 Tax=Runella sp. TaxID=1960881 RepID=UPI003D0C5B3D
MVILSNYGWNHFHQENFSAHTNQELSVGRVVSIKGFKYVVLSEQGESEAELSGKLLYGAAPEELPKVGDWVLFKSYDSIAYLIEVLPRMNELSRKTPGRQTSKQLLATNIDFALVIQGLDNDFNLMRLNRYLVQLAVCRITPIVILNKADLVANPEEYRNEVLRLKHDCPIYLCSTRTGLGMEELKNSVLQKHFTYILIGSSGVGKSSLLNMLLNNDTQKTGNTSDSTGKGKHTTTSRELFLLPNGSLMIDTPGMREFGLTAEEGQESEISFPALQEFAAHCRYSDCKHIDETGCGVLEALQSGQLEAYIYESYLKLSKEQRRFEVKAEDKKRLGKQFGKMTKEANAYRKKYKY